MGGDGACMWYLSDFSSIPQSILAFPLQRKHGSPRAHIVLDTLTTCMHARVLNKKRKGNKHFAIS